jgi:hypothetical protein
MSDVTSDDGNHIWRKGRGWVPINEDAEGTKDALIRELVTALAAMCREPERMTVLAVGRDALDKAKEAGYEP